jgi:hypothetical protein
MSALGESWKSACRFPLNVLPGAGADAALVRGVAALADAQLLICLADTRLRQPYTCHTKPILFNQGRKTSLPAHMLIV